MIRVEQSHHLTTRWDSTTPEFQRCKLVLKEQKIKSIFTKIASTARERWFVLELKSKSAGAYMYAELKYIHIEKIQ